MSDCGFGFFGSDVDISGEHAELDIECSGGAEVKGIRSGQTSFIKLLETIVCLGFEVECFSLAVWIFFQF